MENLENNINETKKAGRSSNFELLRIIAMLMIISYHIFFHCIKEQLSLPTSPFLYPAFYKRFFILSTIAQWGNIGNAIFILISGYFMIKKGKEINTGHVAKKLLTELAVATVFLILFSFHIHMKHQDVVVKMVGLNFFNKDAWFIGYYFLVIVMAKLFLNNFLLKLDKKKFSAFLLTIFAITQFSWSNKILNGISNGLGILVTGIFLYSFGAFISLYNPFEKVRTFAVILVIPIVYAFIYISFFHSDMNKILDYYAEGFLGEFTHSIPIYSNSSIAVILLATAIFELARRVNIGSSKIINFIAAGTLMIYLCHDNSFFYQWWKNFDWPLMLSTSISGFIQNFLYYVFVTFFIGFFVYLIYLFLGFLFKKLRWMVVKE